MSDYVESLMIIAIAVDFMKTALPWIITGLFIAVAFTILPEIKKNHEYNAAKDHYKALRENSTRHVFEAGNVSVYQLQRIDCDNDKTRDSRRISK